MVEFSLEFNDGCQSTREQMAIHNAYRDTISYFYRRSPSPNTIAVGSVDYCLKILPKQAEIINFYPKFLSGYFGRNIRLASREDISPGKFVKSAQTFKSDFTGIVTDSSVHSLKDGHYWISDVVEFKNEWRYYVAKGDVITTEWYDGDDEDKPAPSINVNWPENFSGAVDFGESDGKILLVESHPSFACGWYGEKANDYAYWLITSWKNNSWIL